MKKSGTTRGKSNYQRASVRKTNISGVPASRKPAVRRKKSAAQRRKEAYTRILAIVAAVMVGVLTMTLLYTQVFKEQVDHFFAKKYTVVDAAGVKIRYTAEELAEVVNTNCFYQGIIIDGVDVSGKTMEEARVMFTSTREKTVDELVDIKFQVGDETVKMETDGLTLSSNIDEVLAEAFQYGRTSSLEGVDGLKERYAQIAALKNSPKEYTSSFSIGSDMVSSLAHSALDEYSYQPVEAKATAFDVQNLEFVIEESKEGRSVDVEQAISDVKASFSTGKYQAVIPVKTVILEPRTSAASLRAKLGKVSSNSSKTKDNDNRNTNIWLICKAIDGLVLQPGEQFDFNRFIGERTEEKGYKEAPGILNGTSNIEYGGGICQANTMLYHSVMEADLRVDERVAHSWPSEYVDTGTDATVSWEYPDFKFTNNTDYPIAIHAYYGDLWVTVEIYGRILPDGQYVRFFGNPDYLVDEEPTKTEYVADPTLPVGTVKKERAPHNHIVAEAYKVTYDKDGNELKRDVITTEYRMIIGKYRVGTLASDGTVFYMDPSTGEVSPPAGYTPPQSSSSSESSED